MSRLLLSGVLAAAALIGAAATAPAPPAAVKIGNFTFGPRELVVRPGAVVTWTNEDDTPHTVVAMDGSFRSRPLDTGESFAFTFTRPGAYAYFCSLHPMMTGKVVVKAD